jgi:hypothetical protein
MRYGLRISKNRGVAGGGGVLFTGILLALLQWTFLAALVSCVGAIVVATALAAAAAFHKDTRKGLLRDALRGCITQDTEENLSGLPKIWGVYVVWDHFHHGADPQKGVELVRLYPDMVSKTARVVVFPDAAGARSAARKLNDACFTFDELVAMYARYRSACCRFSFPVAPLFPREFSELLCRKLE